MPGISNQPSFSHPASHSPHGSPQKKTVRLEENPHVSAFLSPKSRVFTGGHGYPGPSARGGSLSAASVPTQAFSISGKQLTPDEVAQKVASMLKPGPPFFSRVSNADLLDFISDGSIMNCDKLRAAAAEVEAKKAASRAAAAFVPSGTVVRRRAEEERWTGVGTVWSSLESLPAGASWGKIPGTPTSPTGSTLSVKSASNPLEDDGLWNAITLSCDLECTSVELAQSVVVPTQVLHENHFFHGNTDALFDEIGAGTKYKFDSLLTKAGLRHKASSIHLGGASSSSGSKVAPNYLSLSAYTDPNSAAFSATSFKLEWPSWMPWVKKSTSTAPASPDAGSGGTAAGGQKRVWIPSATKVSIHASWWGFNLYLPPAVLAKLGGDAEEAEKVANLINSCLTYLLNNVPAGLPPAFAAVLTILKAIAPTTGYISTFIGWSWSTILSFNKGQGVILSATWILPVALIPRPWDAPTDPASGSPPSTTTPPATGTTPAPAPAPTPTPTPTPAPAGSAPSNTAPSAGAGADASRAARTGRAAIRAVTTPTSSTTTPATTTPAPVPAPVPAPGATLPPANPSTVELDFSAPAANNTTNQIYPGDPHGRGGDQSTSAPMGNTAPPANQVPNDVTS